MNPNPIPYFILQNSALLTGNHNFSMFIYCIKIYSGLFSYIDIVRKFNVSFLTHIDNDVNIVLPLIPVT